MTLGCSASQPPAGTTTLFSEMHQQAAKTVACVGRDGSRRLASLESAPKRRL